MPSDDRRSPAPTNAWTTFAQPPRHTPIWASVVAVITAIALCVSLVGFGLYLCLLPQTTTMLAERTVDVEHSPYSHDQLVVFSNTFRDLTIDGPDALNREITLTMDDEIYARIGTAAEELDASVLKRYGISRDALLNTLTPEESGKIVSERSDVLGLPDDAYRHLVDVHAVIAGALPCLLACNLLAFVGIIVLAASRNRAALSRVLRAAPAILACVFVVLGLWGAFDFNGLFTVFHDVLFPQGNWTFSYDSLLICSLPTDFWMGMAALWAVTTVVACIICIVIGFVSRPTATGKKTR